MTQETFKPSIMMGNEALGRALIDAGSVCVTSYPGTPASEILGAAAAAAREATHGVHVEWSVNEKSAYEVALASSYLGCRAAVAMKQVGLNVASDPLMSSAYTGVAGGFIVISADDPGPHSSQTEQDSRLMAMLAKIPVLDPATPQEAYDLVETAFGLSEAHKVPVMIRPTTRVCHARQNVQPAAPDCTQRPAVFTRDPQRWAATPKYRLTLHGQLNRKLDAVATHAPLAPVRTNGADAAPRRCILASGVAWAHVMDLLEDLGLHDAIALYKATMPYPLDPAFLDSLASGFDAVLVVEEPYPVMELQFADRRHVHGRLDGTIPREGELGPDSLHACISRFAGIAPPAPVAVQPGGRRPSLCAGCPHRASFFAIRAALPDALFPGDIGCYTLGVNLGVVDTCLCMGASINMAAGFYHAQVAAGEARPVVATIGDSTFIHSGVTALINAVYSGARFVVVILDNATTAMTGNQPTAATGVRADGTRTTPVSIEALVTACGAVHLDVVDPYDIPAMQAAVVTADVATRAGDGGVAVVIARHPCLMGQRPAPVRVRISDACTGCGFCVTRFECPALERTDDGAVRIDPLLCSACGVCVHVCPVQAITVEDDG